ncbi:M20 family metallo-hydrolase [Halomonas caseinilytica]|uniref:M20 family metallo-hydrolase n=1 Tax=Halomonas caseinilytica TaxID=438744 RepID=UPI0007E5AE8E|nr:M20 family metallo-hydrolase [Halomonas caseinilytica]SEM37204.1 N-carbamoyl-L-amino-acid hydrolase [Halomonas caseinilytica]
MQPTTTASTRINIDGERLWRSLMDMAAIGPSPNGGSRRLALTEEDIAGRLQFRQWVEALGCRCRLDEAGNLFVRREGRDTSLAPVAFGSHLDTQPLGGRFDGVLGVLAGLEILRSLHERDVRTRRPLELVVWTNEEGSRFAPAMGGSGVYAGRLETSDFFHAEDADGIRLADALEASGQRGDLPLGTPVLDAYFELHIEQGPVLEQSGDPLGVVTGVQGIRWFDVRISGQSAHAGPTPMSHRRDPLLAAADGLVAIRDDVEADPSGDARLTIGELKVTEPSRNVIPAEVNLMIDLRHVDDTRLDELEAMLYRRLDAAASKAGVSVDIERRWRSPVTPFDPDLIASLDTAARERGLSLPHMMSGAGHDAVNVSHVAPTVMLFTPCRDGISHNEAEFAEPEHCALGAQVLCDAILARANRA